MGPVGASNTNSACYLYSSRSVLRNAVHWFGRWAKAKERKDVLSIGQEGSPISRKFIKQYPGQGALSDAILGITLDWGTAIPTDATAGYATGCIFIVTNASAGQNTYQNVGTQASCDFNLLTGVDLSGLTATAAELNLNAGQVATAAEVNRSSDMNTRVVDCTASTLTVTEALHDGKVVTLNLAAGIAVTLPVPVAGMWFRFVVQTTFTGAASIKSVAGTHIMIGHAIMGNDSDNTTVMWQALAASTFDTINLFGTANSTGGIAGQTIDIKALSSTVWMVEIQGDAAGTEATPFENTVA